MNSPILIYIPEEAFLSTGDATQVYIQKDVDMEQWLAQLEHFSGPDVNMKMILTGHSERPFAEQDLGSLRNYLATIWGSVRRAHGQGPSLEQIQSQCSLDDEMSRSRFLADKPFDVGTVKQFTDTHKKNIGTSVP